MKGKGYVDLSERETCEKEKDLIKYYNLTNHNKGCNLRFKGEYNSASIKGRKRISITNKGKRV